MSSAALPSHKPRHVCELCDVRVESAATLQAHFAGKRHQRLVSLQHGRQSQADRSVFVTGFHKGTSELELTDYFSRYGDVANVFLDKDKGAYAIIEFSDKAQAQAVLQSPPHVLKGQELTVKPREVKAFSPKRKHRRQSSTTEGGGGQGSSQEELFSALGCQQSVDDQMAMLTQYRQLPSEGVRVRYLICHLLQEVFQEFFPACRVFPFGSSVNGLGRPECDLDMYLDFGRCKFDYQFVTYLNNTEPSASSISEKNSPDVTRKQESSVMNPGSTHSAELERENVISTEDIESASVEEVLELLARILKRCAPGCGRVQVVPSSRCPVVKFTHKDTGLSCDISINNRLALHNTELLHLYGSAHPGLKPLVYVVREWAKLCGIAGNSDGGGPRLTNYALTWMVVYYMQTEGVLPSVQELRDMCVREWAKLCGIAGNNDRRGPRLTNYALTWMVVYYMQREGVLPSVQELRDVCDPSEKLSVDGWDCSFTRQVERFPNKGKTLTQDDLLKGFFQFFSKFEFETSVVSPLTGQHLSITQVSANQSISTAGVQGQRTNQNVSQSQASEASTSHDAFGEGTANEDSDGSQQFKIGPINIQDPFELSHNVAGNVNEKTAQRIAEEFSTAAEICAKQNFSTKMSYLPDSVPWGVAKLLKNAVKSRIPSKKQSLHQTPTGSPNPQSPGQRSPGMPSEMSLDLHEKEFAIPIQMKMSKLPSDFVTSFSNSKELKLAWCEKVEGFVEEIFTQVLKMEEQLRKNTNFQESLDEVKMEGISKKMEDIQERLDVDTEITQSDVSLDKVEHSDVRSRKRPHSPETEGPRVKVKHVECSKGIESSNSHIEVKGPQDHLQVVESMQNKSQDLLPNDVEGSGSFLKEVSTSQDDVKVKDESLQSRSDPEKCDDDISEGEEGQKTELKNMATIQGTSSDGNTSHLLVTYSTRHRVWVGRRKVRRQLARDAIPGLSLEKQVSNQILEQDPGGGTEMVFQVHFGRKLEVNCTTVELRFIPGRGDREFRDLFHFLELFLVKMVDNHMME